MEIITRCDIGSRAKNQDYVDYIKISDDEAILVVCDGMGGHAAGEVASALVARFVLDNFSSHGEFKNDDDIKGWLHILIHEANNLVYRKSLENDSYKGMGTTIVVAYIKEDNVYIAHVGDSRAYLVGETIRQITSDDTLVNALVKSGTISQLEAKYHPKKNVLLQAVGVSSPLNISFYKEVFHDELLICSDGLYNSLNDQSILEIFHRQDTLDGIGNELLTLAKEYGGLDNIGFIIAGKGE